MVGASMETPEDSNSTPGPVIAVNKQRLLERQLKDVQRIAHVGTWEYWAASQKLTCKTPSFLPASMARPPTAQ